MEIKFTDKINGKPSYFVEKIWECIFQKGIQFKARDFEIGLKVLQDGYKLKSYKPKLHTIRQDIERKYQTGSLLKFTMNGIQFAPTIPIVTKQRIFMTYMPHFGNGFEVSIDGKQRYGKELEELAVNDGFDSLVDFEDFFISKMIDYEYSAVIIHWTDFRY